jgi:short-subunit dehydrogenase
MAVQLRKLDEQVIVITGATSGIGLTTARAAAEGGARLVLAARNGEALDQLASELRRKGTQVATVAADVGIPSDVERIGQAAMERFGRIDTWVNNAGISIFGRNEDVALEDMQRLFQTNYWGVVHGSLEAVRHMKKRGGGAIINLGSELSDHSVPLQGIYAASKHAVKAFTDSLRMELEKEGAPISVTLIKPAGIDTMFGPHAKNYMDKEPSLPPPVYAPQLVAKSILYSAQHQKRDVYVGTVSRLNSLGRFSAPGLFERFTRLTMFKLQQSDRPSSPNRRDALYESNPHQELRERYGNYGPVMESCPYTALSLRKGKVVGALLGAGAAYATWNYSRRPALRRAL